MKHIIIIMYFFVLSNLLLNAQEMFDEYFFDKTMRIDYYHIGDAVTEIVTIDHIYEYGIWAGSRKNLVDNFNNGRYYIKVYDSATDEVIFSKGFDSYFGEYKTSAKAADGTKRTFHETAIIPLPKNKIKFSLEQRDENKKLFEFFSVEIDPSDISIIRDEILDQSVITKNSYFSGDPHTKVDIAIIGEGYSKNDIKKFDFDLNRFTNIFFEQEPYKSQKDMFNIYGVLKPSEESGVDEPRADIYKNTSLDATFNSMGSERYLLTENNKALYDIAAHVPYDALYIMVNHSRYGGGGIYNFFCTFTSDNQFHKYLFIHEFGHSFTGLADEYYTSSVAYNDFYPRGIEPVEPNITALLNPEDIKWKHVLSNGVEIPTPWEKADFDTMDYAWQKERRKMNDHIAELKKYSASIAEITDAEEEYNRKDREHSNEVDKYLKASKYRGKVGVFEGAGYSAKGLYRPMLDCIMFSKGDKPFCKVCEEAINRVIQHYTE